jgi:hypothetical protein
LYSTFAMSAILPYFTSVVCTGPHVGPSKNRL